MVLAAQALEAQKADKPLEQGGALERVAARIKRVIGLTCSLRGAETGGEAGCWSVPLEAFVRHFQSFLGVKAGNTMPSDVRSSAGHSTPLTWMISTS